MKIPLKYDISIAPRQAWRRCLLRYRITKLIRDYLDRGVYRR